MSTVKGRSYQSPLRQQQALATRDRLAATAMALFTEKGYQATTVAEIAKGAGVSVPTVHAVLDGKRGIARHLLREAILGLRLPEGEGPEPGRILDSPTGRGKLTEICTITARIGRRGATIYRILLDASGDPEIATLLRDVGRRRFDRMTLYAEDLAASKLLRVDVGRERGRDILYWASSPQLYLQMVTELDWTEEEFVSWLLESLTDMLLERRSAAMTDS